MGDRIDPAIVVARDVIFGQVVGDYFDHPHSIALDEAEELARAALEAAAPLIAAKALEDVASGSTEVVQEARIHYSYGVNSGTLMARNTPESVRAAIKSEEQRTMGCIGIDLIETRTVLKHASPWTPRADTLEAGQS